MSPSRPRLKVRCVRLWGALAIACLGCHGDVGTLRIGLITAPGADPLADATLVRMRLSSPERVVEEELEDGPQDLEIDISARQGQAIVTFEAEDEAGEIVARGRTPVLPLSGIDFDLNIYVAAPWSVSAAPVSFESPRSGVAGAALGFGAALFGGQLAAGELTGDALIYNAFQHGLQTAADLPEPRAYSAAASDPRGLVYVFGGIDAQGDARATTYRFNTSTPPAGSYATLMASETLARTDASLVFAGSDRLLITGSPLGLIDGITGTALPFPGAELEGQAASFVLGDDLFATSLVVGASTAALLREDQVQMLEPPPGVLREGHAMVSVGDRALAIGGRDPDSGALLADVAVYDVIERSFAVEEGFLPSPRAGFAAVVTASHVVVVGGVDGDGAILSDVLIYDRETLELVRSLAMAAPRLRPTVLVLPTAQVLIAGGEDPDGAGTELIELVNLGE